MQSSAGLCDRKFVVNSVVGHPSCSVAVDIQVCSTVRVGCGALHLQHRLLHNVDHAPTLLQTYLAL